MSENAASAAPGATTSNRPFLERAGSWRAGAVGLLAGLLLGGVLWLPDAAAAPLFLAFLGAAVWLARGARPVAVFQKTKPVPQEPPPPEPEPEPAKDEPTPPDTDPPLTCPDGFARIPAGTFLMGSPGREKGRDDDEGPVHEVRISEFCCMIHPVTRELYGRVMGQTVAAKEARAPQVEVSWFEAVEFCNRWSLEEGLTPCYEKAAAMAEGRTKAGDWRWNREADGFRLPTEAEWEYACRAGTDTRFSFGDDESRLGEFAWHSGNSGRSTKPVGGKQPNPWGLHDMHGNVWEWVWDWHGPYEPDDPTGAPPADPQGPGAGEARVMRGGSSWNEPRYLRSAHRDGVRPELRGESIGFRCVRGSRRLLDL